MISEQEDYPPVVVESCLQVHLCGDEKPWTGTVEFVANALWEKVAVDEGRRNVVKLNGRDVSWHNQRRHYGHMLNAINKGFLEHINSEPQTDIFAREDLLRLSLKYVVIADEIIKRALTFLYKGRAFGGGLFLPCLREFNTEWSVADCGNTILYLMSTAPTLFGAEMPDDNVCLESVIDGPEYLGHNIECLFQLAMLHYLLMNFRSLYGESVSLADTNEVQRILSIENNFELQLYETTTYVECVYCSIRSAY